MGGFLVCDPIALQAEGWMQPEAAAGARQSCQLLFQWWCSAAKQAKCISCCMPACTRRLCNGSEWMFQWTAQGVSHNGTFYQACTFPWKLLIELVSGCKEDGKAVQECWKAWELFESWVSCSACPWHRDVPVQLPGLAGPLDVYWHCWARHKGLDSWAQLSCCSAAATLQTGDFTSR